MNSKGDDILYAFIYTIIGCVLFYYANILNLPEGRFGSLVIIIISIVCIVNNIINKK